jgi:hypothetical protein
MLGRLPWQSDQKRIAPMVTQKAGAGGTSLAALDVRASPIRDSKKMATLAATQKTGEASPLMWMLGCYLGEIL